MTFAAYDVVFKLCRDVSVCVNEVEAVTKDVMKIHVYSIITVSPFLCDCLCVFRKSTPSSGFTKANTFLLTLVYGSI